MKFREESIENIVIGSGAAGLQAALRLHQNGETNLALLTEHITSGTSRNTGSDKQTYYKLSIAGDDMDSVKNMAEDLFAGQCVDGDQALCEAALSARCYYRLVELGVPFPCNEYGEYMGYKTDHDRGRRATSAGPYTSKLMTECLEKECVRQGIRFFDRMQAIKLLVSDKQIHGVLCLDTSEHKSPSYVLFWCKNLILATGGPAGIYYNTVYPSSQLGSSGIAFEAGVNGKNLTEWQFGIASVNPRWNVSGTYMQVLPKVVSVSRDGSDEREFLLDYFKTPEEMLSMLFLKGYQWPFDVNKIFGGSSIIDLLVYQETILRGRKVYLDFRENTCNKEIPYHQLSAEAFHYLEQAGALFGTPIERLARMNEPAIRFYQDHGVNLYEEKLEIAVCAQHNNGGLSTDSYWETNIKGLFAVGELCGSHGVTRPGGSALNAGQVGAVRAAEKIHLRKLHNTDSTELIDIKNTMEDTKALLRKESEDFLSLSEHAVGDTALSASWTNAAKRMSACGGIIRDQKKIKEALRETEAELEHYETYVKKPNKNELALFYRLHDMLTSQKVYLSAMLDYIEHGGGSRGSALYTDDNGTKPDEKLPDLYKCLLDQGTHGTTVQEVRLENGKCTTFWRNVRPIPELDYFFETQWKAYRERMKI